ncbi:hypothetical protein HYPSUDRAFT_1010195 [Hypholoma sublateritium FD-334 SS-4]|uniref:Uncharacterized protein n=1 Tax=Hypholoma sublateritium (strain FD-334 SS-4) TaxID=945553 RepID=A0A0D2M335_HYPSF|nr:hypothetical protein HYPSUDRAFT_1010195 [Hypholoma sublateritium FD-334 SS-4]
MEFVFRLKQVSTGISGHSSILKDKTYIQNRMACAINQKPLLSFRELTVISTSVLNVLVQIALLSHNLARSLSILRLLLVSHLSPSRAQQRRI